MHIYHMITVYSHSDYNIPTIFHSNLELRLKPSFSIHISVSVSTLFVNLASFRIGILPSTFWGYIFVSLPKQNKLMLILLSAHNFLFGFYPWPYTLKVSTSSHETTFLSTAANVFHDLF